MTALPQSRGHARIMHGYRCIYCQCSMTPAGTPGPQACTAEPLKPRAKGGDGSAANIAAACWSCIEVRHHRPNRGRNFPHVDGPTGHWPKARCSSR